MQIKVNGKPYQLETKLSVAGLARLLELNASQIAVERNREIVPRSSWNEVILDEADEIEIVRFIGGG